MNPGYAGRSELPDNLKALFRPVAMMVPDYGMIAEIMLFSFGFSTASSLARKMVATFRLSSEQLSSQDHYDFGMRAVKTVISAAGNLKRQSPHMDESLLLLRALRDCNMPKFLADDIPLFNGIISDLFPGVVEVAPDYGLLMESIEATIKEMQLQPVPSFKTKCIQLYETTVVRHGLMLVGPTGGGKTTCYRVLARALTRLKDSPPFARVKTFVLNPKSITMGQLYGESDKTTHEWNDGILANLVRMGATDTKPDKKWIIFDGPVDAIWIENMNTVLDDNKKLCLTSGEIIQLKSNMSMIFEVEDLAVASPATVSRCGMVYMDPNDLGIPALIQSFMDRLHESLQTYKAELATLFNIYLMDSIAFIRRECKETVPTTDSNLAKSLMNILDCLVAPYVSDPEESQTTNAEGAMSLPQSYPPIATILEPCFLFALVWSVGASVDHEGRMKFDAFLRNCMDSSQAAYPPPAGGLVYDYCFDTPSGSWRGWMETVPPYVPDLSLPFSQLIVPTMDSVRYQFVLNLLMRNGKNVLCVGPTGTGKTVSIMDTLLNSMPAKYSSVVLSFSAQTSANQTQDILDSRIEKRRKGVFGPPLGRKLVVFVDDLNMPKKEKYGAQPPVELLRQWMDHDGWYDRKSMQFKKVVDVQFVCAMGPPGGGRNPITPRFTRHFNFLSFTFLEKPSLQLIFSTILTAFLKQFPDNIRALSLPIVDATIDVFNTISAELLPTPSKSHYTFNLRDLSKVFQGILSGDPNRLKISPVHLARLWVHECMRVFSDRLVDEGDRRWFVDLLKTSLAMNIQISWDSAVPHNRLIYGDFIVPNADPKVYTEMDDMPRLTHAIESYLEYYNATTEATMKLVMFEDAIEHVARICRIIRQPGGNALLLGMGGSGRQSLTRLAASIAEYEAFQIEITKKYAVTEWREDVKKVLRTAGLDGKPIVFLFSDTQIKDEIFLEDINNILNSGDVPNIWAADERENILSVVQPIAQSAGVPLSKESVYAYFTQRVMKNIHVVLCMSPIGDSFRNRLRMFPSLVNCSTIDWFSGWPEDALCSVAASAIADMSFQDTLKDAVVSMCVRIYQSVESASLNYAQELNRHNYVTPTSYLELLSLFGKIIQEKRAALEAQRGRFQVGVDQLLKTAQEVAVLQEELENTQPLLQQASQETEDTLRQIERDKKSADETREMVKIEEEKAEKEANETKAIADDAKRDLDEALPALESAIAALQTLNKNDITEVKSMVRPPNGVKLVMEAICIMKGIKPKKVEAANKVGGPKELDYWEPAKQLLSDQKFLDSLMKYDKDNIPDSVIQNIQPYIMSEDFRPFAISKVSRACTSLCLWVRAMEKYYHVSQGVAPKRARLAEAEQRLAATLRALEGAKAKLHEVEENVKDLEGKYAESVAKKSDLTAKVRECEQKLERAQKLIGGLSDEKTRWKESSEELDMKLSNLVGDVLLSSGVIAFLGAFTSSYRNKLVQQWNTDLQSLAIPHTPNCTINTTLTDPIKIRWWNIHGLPSDSLSIENATIVFNSRRWPLMIDPQGQANKWIKSLEKERGLDIIRLSNPDFVRTLENAIRFGKPVLLENVGEELDAVLEPILNKQTFKQSGNTVIKLGDNIIPYHDDFRFYITTKLPNPHYKPETSTKVTILNFTLTQSGLSDQLLGIVVSKERKDLEDEKNQLVQMNAQMKAQLQELEDRILLLLSSAEGNPLEDEELLLTLAESKATSAEILLKVHEAEKNEKNIDATRQLYRVVAVRGSILYFCITDLATIDPMYQYSLTWFINLFVLSIQNSEQSNELDLRLTILSDYFTYSLFTNVCRSLFEKHKLLFSFLLCTKIMQHNDTLSPADYRFLLAGGLGLGSPAIPNPAPEWLSDKAWADIHDLSKLPNFENFASHFSAHVDVYKNYFEDSNAHRLNLQPPFDSVSTFQKMLVLKCLRPDLIISSMQEFITQHLGPKFIEPPTFHLASSFKDSNNTTPLIFILSAGADPMEELHRFAEEMRFSKKLESISLGQGQGQRAENMIRDGMERGSWVLLQNCHLAVSWMPALERLVEGLAPDGVHRDFRLWLTSMPSDKFPVSVLQNGIKMTNEPPKGIKANLLRTYHSFDEQFLNTSKKPHQWKKLLFGLCFFHALIQERRKFGALGWNIPYEYTSGDLQICIRQLNMFLAEYEEIPYKVLKFLAGHINYGGRVTDSWDIRTLMNLLDSFYTPDILEPHYVFSPSGVYYSPSSDSLSSYMTYLKTLPINDDPEVFGLHPNANLTFLQMETNNLFQTLLSLQPRASDGKSNGRSRDEIIEATASNILMRIPDSIQYEAGPHSPHDSMSTVLGQEVIRYNRLLKVINTTLRDLCKAIKGLVVMSVELDSMANCLYDNQVPGIWADRAYPSLMTLSHWVLDLERRLEFLLGWIKQGKPKVFWISGFFFPQAFLTGTLQNFARKHVISIDTISFEFHVLDKKEDDILSPPEDGVYIRGLFLEGARWDNDTHSIAESHPKKLYVELPVIWLKPVVRGTAGSAGGSKSTYTYPCPVYKTLRRAGTLSTTGHSTNYVLTIDLPSIHHAEHWVKRGVAAICSLNYVN
eukprot:Phypoly_transcript_00043.p1 GENE.Phypoly_transcript_00043~~Phypoly_transcript_00043.p1  ORF type:complete len:2765 (+),score=358.08 Phypoly_transcript_00043:606-8297(+)